MLEDNKNFTAKDLEELGVPKKVVENVVYLTRPAGSSYMEYIRSLRDKPVAKTVKLADLRHNSDLKRLPEVTEEDLKRAKKYQKAIRILSES